MHILDSVVAGSVCTGISKYTIADMKEAPPFSTESSKLEYLLGNCARNRMLSPVKKFECIELNMGV